MRMHAIETRMIPVHPSSLVTHDDRGLELHLSREMRERVDGAFAAAVVAIAVVNVVFETDDDVG